jgi:hypothetical protein
MIGRPALRRAISRNPARRNIASTPVYALAFVVVPPRGSIG